MTDGELILAWTNLGALVECWLRFFYCVYYEDYMKNPKLGKKGKPLEPDDKAMSFDYLIQYSKGILWDNLQDPLIFGCIKSSTIETPSTHSVTGRSGIQAISSWTSSNTRSS